MRRFNISLEHSPDDVSVLIEDTEGKYVKFDDIPFARTYQSGYRRSDDDIVVIIVENDTFDPLTSAGAIIMEQYTSASPEEVMERAKMFADQGKYGRVWTARLDGLAEVPRIQKVPPSDIKPQAE